MCSHATSLPSAEQTRFCLIRAPSSSWTMWKWTSFGDTALQSFTGTFTRPKLIAPLHIDRGMETLLSPGDCSPAGLNQRVPQWDAPARLKATGAGLNHE